MVFQLDEPGRVTRVVVRLRKDVDVVANLRAENGDLIQRLPLKTHKHEAVITSTDKSGVSKVRYDLSDEKKSLISFVPSHK